MISMSLVGRLLTSKCSSTHCYLSHRPYYGLPDGFPLDQLLTRTRIGKKRNIYLASKLVKELTRRNEFSVKVSCIVCTGFTVYSETCA